jgi:NADH dehydrogenase FAD-containing subunit
MNAKKHIVIIGGGFAGLNFAKQLFNNSFYEVTLIDKNNYNYFTPLPVHGQSLSRRASTAGPASYSAR